MGAPVPEKPGCPAATPHVSPLRRSLYAHRVPLWTSALATLALVVIIAGYALSFDEMGLIQRLEAEIQSWGPFGVIASIGLMIIHSFVPFPAEFLAIANGMAFGLGWGIVVTWSGGMLGAFAAFGIARWLGRPIVARLVRRKDWERIDDWTAHQGWKLLLISRLIPVIAFNLINYAAGLTRVSWFTFTWTTGIGILPVTVLMAMIGDNIAVMTWEAWLSLAAGGVTLWFVLRRLAPRLTRLTSQNEL